ncbi:MAG: hypothetical protein QUS14_03570, partial [Pyrinomonadaceae bacterium]|nr:hypothetical protein [Pyrinomonadaceae bacterium]
MRNAVVACLLIVIAAGSVLSQRPAKSSLKEQVAAEFLHAWNGYKKHCCLLYTSDAADEFR